MESLNKPVQCTSVEGESQEHDLTTEYTQQEAAQDGNEITDDVSKFPVHIGQVGRRNRKTIKCRRNETVTSLTELIRKEFGLKSKDEILVYERVAIPGNISNPLEEDRKIFKFSKKDFVYDIEGQVPDLSKLEALCCQQNVVFIGSPTHGKSSTINSIAKSLGYRTTIAQTYSPGAAGTRSYTKHELNINTSSFNLWDVPGDAVKALTPVDLTKTFINIFSGKEVPDEVVGQHTRWISRHSRKIHAVVCVQKGTAVTEMLHTVALSAAKQSGRGIPLFVIITHLDKMKKPLQSVKERLSNEIGVDQNVMFAIANDDTKGDQLPDPQKEKYVHSMLEKILLAAKEHKKMLGDAGACEYQ